MCLIVMNFVIQLELLVLFCAGVALDGHCCWLGNILWAVILCFSQMVV